MSSEPKLVTPGCSVEMTLKPHRNPWPRTCLIIMIVVSMGGVFILEQPALRFFEQFPRFVRIYQKLKIFRATWWMLHYGGPTPKRHYAYSNSRVVQRLSRGKLHGWKKRKQRILFDIISTPTARRDLLEHDF